MNILIPIAAPLHYTTGVYLERAFTSLGHEADIVDQSQLNALGKDDADIFVCVDSGGPLNIPEAIMPKASMWYIDSRRNSDPAIRTPDDDTTAQKLLEHGGTVFQSQRRDVERLQGKLPSEFHSKIIWLPLAADPDVWSNEPISGQPKEYYLVAVSNCYDPERLGIYNTLSEEGLLHWPGTEGAVMEEGAAMYRNAMAGLNVPSWFGTPECYDINMRVFEIMSCGCPLITNHLPELSVLGIEEGVHVFTYPTITQKRRDGATVSFVVEEVKKIIERFRQQPGLSGSMGVVARDLILKRHTYVHRAEVILEEML